jgi:hypothetical protein
MSIQQVQQLIWTSILDHPKLAWQSTLQNIERVPFA